MRKRIRLEEPKQKQTTFEFKSNVVKDKIGFAMPTYNRIIYLYRALESIKKQCKGIDYHVYIVEDCSAKQEAVFHLIDELKDLLRYNRVSIISNGENKGLGYSWKRAGQWAAADGCEFVIFCDDDIEMMPDKAAVIHELVSVMREDKNKEIGFVAPTGSYMRKFLSEERKAGIKYKFVSSCGGGFGMARPEAAEYIGWHDPNCRRAVDVDFCLRMWLSGKACALTLDKQVYHKTHKAGGLDYPKDRTDPRNEAWQQYLIDKFDPIVSRNKKGHLLFWRAFKSMSPDVLLALRRRVLNKDDMSIEQAETWLKGVNSIA